jgi:Mg2+/Co2+ transporter CorB
MARVDRARYQKEMSHFKETYPQEYEILQEFNRNKQLKNKRKKLAKLEDLKDLDIDDIMIE